MSDTTSAPSPLAPSPRFLYGPGPSNVAPSVVEAMQRPMHSHLDPYFHGLLTEIGDMLRNTYRQHSGQVLPLSYPGTTGMEAGIMSLLDPGDTAVIAAAGVFGERLIQAVRRYGAEVVEVRADYGQAVPNERIIEALDQNPQARLVGVVHAETSTGVRHPLAELAEALRGRDVLLMADCVTSLGGIELEVQRWGIDYAYSCSQKCLGAPPGMSPVAVSDRALERAGQQRVPAPYSFDLNELVRYYVERPPTYHHTVPILQLYALHEALRLVAEEGLEQRWQRHADAGAYLQGKLRERGFELLADPAHQLPQLSAVRVPEGVDGPAVQQRLLRDVGMEVGGPLGASGPSIWRIGLMGVNATRDAADHVVASLESALAAETGDRSGTASVAPAAGGGQAV